MQPGMDPSNPYTQMAANPGMYTGSGYNNGAAPMGNPAATYPQNFSAPPRAPAGTVDPSVNYQEFTEDAVAAAPPSDKVAGGIAPRRLSDCVCIPIFLLYIFVMVCIACSASARGDTQRLTHGHDYEARLCGVGDMWNKPYVFFCRSYEDLRLGNKGDPISINNNHGSCVASCPKDSVGYGEVECLLRTMTRVSPGVTNAGGVVASALFHANQSVVMAPPYATELALGRYCLPTNLTLKSSLLGFKGTLNMGHRAVNAFGSYQRAEVWLVLFCTCLLTALFSFIYIYAVHYAVKWLMWTSLIICLLISLAGSIFFFFGLFAADFVDCTDTANLQTFWCQVQDKLGTEPGGKYQHLNPLFHTFHVNVAAVLSMLCSLGLAILMLFMYELILAGEMQAWSIQGFVAMSYEIIMSMKLMFVVPMVETVVKFFLWLIFTKNIMIMLTVGYVDDRRIIVNKVHYEGAEKTFYYDWWFMPWMVVFWFGCVWCMNLVNTFGQWTVSFTVIAWWYVPKEGGKKVAPTTAPLLAVYNGLRYHLGSLIMHSAWVPIVRPYRLLRKYQALFPSASKQKEMQDNGTWAQMSGFQTCQFYCLKWINNVVFFLGDKLLALPPFVIFGSDDINSGRVAEVIKDALNDVVVRSTHYVPSAERTIKLYRAHPPCQANRGKTYMLTLVGTCTVGFAASAICYWMLQADTLSNPKYDTYVQDPVFVTLLSFPLHVIVSYSWLVLLDHTPDVLLYAYIQNMKDARMSVDSHIPDALRAYVGGQDKNKDTYMYYGKTKPIHYLATWMNTNANDGTFDPPAPKKDEARSLVTTPQMEKTAVPAGYSAVPMKGP
eukprot:TRINITY_DN101801_c0_g1_i1.p1 TRINITY_DN101801_c0_g1~~TRINITY_DN101801_c0_g1_i1.p1  ORF type:complete len:831 (+),score=121.09 TRINITY_DN101801_c0_g1_i1:110-2602(+)